MRKALPNALTIFRIAAAVPIVALLLVGDPAARWIALALYVAACLTDVLDGWLARRLDAASPFGRMLDPIADKVLIGSLTVALCATGDAPAIPAAAIVFRELLVSGMREHLASRAVVLRVTTLARWKTTVQMLAVGFLLPGAAGIPFGEAGSTLDAGQGLLWVAAALTAVSGWSYLKAGVRELREAPS